MLIRAVQSSVLAGKLERADGEVWLATRALVGAEQVRTIRARPPAHREGCRQARTTCERVERQLAKRPFYPPAQPDTRDTEHCIADLHVRLAWHQSLDPVEWAALRRLKRELGHPTADGPGVSRHRRRRAADRQRRDLLRSSPTLTPVPTSSKLVRLNLTTVSQILALDNPYVWDHHDLLRGELKLWQLSHRDVACLPRDVAIRAWGLQCRVWREDEDIRAVAAARILRQLTGDSLETVHSLRDVAIVLQAHGYRQLSVKACTAALRVLGTLELEPWVQATERGQVLARQGLVKPTYGRLAEYRDKLRLLDQAYDATIAGGEPAERAGLADIQRKRVEIEIEHHAAVIRSAVGRPKHLHLDDALLTRADAAVEQKRGDSLLRATWHATLMRWALAAGSPTDFVRAAEEFASRLQDLKTSLPNQYWKYRALVNVVDKRKGAWRHLDLPPFPKVDAIGFRPATQPWAVVP
jgi:hypothetical protein